jgi:hypothetical protein
MLQMQDVINEAKRLAQTYKKVHYINNTKYGWQVSPVRTADSVSFAYPTGSVSDYTQDEQREFAANV